SVTPMSNDAEIFSAPLICKRRALRAGEGDHLAALARKFHPEALLSVVPTGVGFCMALNIKWLRKEPRLDPAFGRGYGEEVDWCQRVRARGGRHLGLPGLFVEHRGGESFGSAQKQALVQANNRIITERYPGYDREVRDFITADPMVTARLALALGLVGIRAGEAPVTIALAHTLGGGADDYLEQRLAQTVRQIGGAVILRVGGRQRWQIEVLTPEGRICGHTDDFTFIETLLDPIRTRHILYSCGVGDRDPVRLPGLLARLKRQAWDQIEVLFHDFFPLSPSYCLLEADGAYRGVPRSGTRNAAHTTRRPDGTRVDLSGWRSAWAGLLAQAETLTVFSQDSRRLVAQVYPACAPRIVVAPHALLTPVPRVQAPPPRGGQCIGVLGNIGYQKGAQVVQDMAVRMGDLPGRAMVVIGNMDPSFALPDHVHVHGTYRVSDLARLATRYGITDWLIPSVWPETFSYTTHEALATGLPVWGFHLGAQGEALMQARNGHLIHFDPDSDLADTVLAALTVDRKAAAA
uniref:glycosyltransferase n=1 Tax=Tropicimonas sp. S265A TaxID=3415134 RepID=UPI003C7E8128